MTGAESRRDGTVVLTADQFAELTAAADQPLETAAVLLGTLHEVHGRVRFLLTDIRWVPDDAYLDRREDGLRVGNEGFLPALAEAEDRGLAALWMHTHPGREGRPTPSLHDHRVNTEIADLFRLRTGSGYYGTLVVSPRADGLAFTGDLSDETSSRDLTRIVVVGDRMRLLASHNRDPGGDGGGDGAERDLFSRNVAAFGGPVQAALGMLRVTVVGAGGTGSAVAEQLVRLGVRHLLLVDPDALEASNTTRVYGSTPGDVGSDKAKVLARHLRAIAPDADVLAVVDSVNSVDAARLVTGSDVVFGCTDDNSGRAVLSRTAYYARVVVIDCGIQLSSGPDATLSGIDGRVTLMSPGSPCLICRGRVDLARAAAEQMSHEEHARLAGEGYAPALPGVQPAVVTFTTAVAAQAVTELLEMLTGFGPSPRPSEIILRLHDREVSTNTAHPRPGHFCDPSADPVAQLGREPFLGKTWVR